MTKSTESTETFRELVITSPDEKRLRALLRERTDTDAARIKRFLAMPDLSRAAGSPVRELVLRILAIPDFKSFDVIKVPEIVSAKECFDPFNFPPRHPARSTSDTYFVTEEFILRTHTTVMWAYHLALPEVKEATAEGKAVGALSYGKVYRKDEIDRHHMNVFHQIDGWYLARKEEFLIGIPELKEVLAKIARAIYGPDINFRFNKDQFPYTDPSLEMEVEINNRWIEVLGSGVVHPEVLQNFGIDPTVWNGWAFGFGLERLAILSMDLPDIRLLWSDDERVKRQLKLGNSYKEVSKFPPVIRDISFIVDKSFVPNNYFDLIRDIGGDLVEEVALLDRYENEAKFGKGRASYTYRIVYRSHERTLTASEVEPIQDRVVEETTKQFNAEVR